MPSKGRDSPPTYPGARTDSHPYESVVEDMSQNALTPGTGAMNTRPSTTLTS